MPWTAEHFVFADFASPRSTRSSILPLFAPLRFLRTLLTYTDHITLLVDALVFLQL